MLTVLAVDDEPPALAELAHLLGADPLVDRVLTATDATGALRALEGQEADVVFLDIKMPGLSGVDLARILTQFRRPPAVVFVTASDEHALEAFDVRAVDYVMKPYRPQRLSAALRRAVSSVSEEPPEAEPEDETIPVERGGVTRFLRRSEVAYVDAHGDYVRLHTAEGSHLVRIPISTLEERWAEAGFVRIHRSHLVALEHIKELRIDGGRWSVVIGNITLPVSRRQSREIRDRLVRRAGGA